MNIPFIFGLITSLALALCSSTLGYEFAIENFRFLEALSVIFSILAGILLAAYTLLGDTSTLSKHNPRYKKLRTIQSQRIIKSYSILFCIYIVILLLVTMHILLWGGAEERKLSLDSLSTGLLYQINLRGVLFLSSFAGLISLGLPSSIRKLIQLRLDEESNA